jgi:hypothetical protein
MQNAIGTLREYGEVKRGRVGDALDFMEKCWECTYEKEIFHKDLKND